MSRFNVSSMFRRNPLSKSGVAALAVMALVLPACNVDRQAATPTNATAQKIANNTDRWIGQTVTIRSEPLKKIAPSTFTMSSNQFFGQEPILVVNASGKPFVLPAGQNPDVQVTGQ
ncbi:MAG: hypothetical protein HC936_03345, partial [Leptolyngbyaceae cyanobacterium SU_3_3]|nr:hypothetical protein [Leptolyngbyaceae cyanobacterium SU_3_3]